MMTSDVGLPIWKREPHPAVVAVLIIALVLIIGYGAYVNDFLPIKPKSEFEVRLGQLVRESGGDFSKLKPADQEYLNKHTSGRGGLAFKEYLKQK